jgi:hypothetical protein
MFYYFAPIAWFPLLFAVVFGRPAARQYFGGRRRGVQQATQTSKPSTVC